MSLQVEQITVSALRRREEAEYFQTDQLASYYKLEEMIGLVVGNEGGKHNTLEGSTESKI